MTKKKEPTQAELIARLIKLNEGKSKASVFEQFYVSYRTYKAWTTGERPINGALRALIEAREELNRLCKMGKS